MVDTRNWLPNGITNYRPALFGKAFYESNDGIQAMHVGVKIHVSANKNSAEYLTKLLIPYLRGKDVFHKIQNNTDLLDNIATDNQARKFITVYPQGAKELDALCDGMERLLMDPQSPIGLGPGAECRAIEGDLPYGRAGYLFLRHGKFDSGGDDDRTTVSAILRAYYMEGKTEGLFVARPTRTKRN
jgi:hypothetical protein